MSKSKIEWCDRTWNPISGCAKISEGCNNCYAERMHTRLEHIKGSGYDDGQPHFSVRLHPERLEEPLKWKKPQRVFVCSMGDLFHEDVPYEYLHKIFAMIAKAKMHKFLILTKRPDRMLEYILSSMYDENISDDGWYAALSDIGIPDECPPENVFYGVTVENQQAADERIPILLQIPAAKRFISIEPMVNFVDLSKYIGSQSQRSISLCITGGETGPKARPMDVEWARSVRDQCQAAGVPFFMKSMGAHSEIPSDLIIKEFPDAK